MQELLCLGSLQSCEWKVALPIGAQRTVSELKPIPVDPSQKGSGLLNAVLALLAPQNPDENERYDEEVLDLSAAAFLVV